MRGETAIAFRITSLKVSIHKGEIVKGEVEISLGKGTLLLTDSGKDIFINHAKTIGEKILGKEIPEWILDYVWDEFNEMKYENLNAPDEYVPLTSSMAA